MLVSGGFKIMYLHLLFYMIFNYEAYLEIPIIG